MQHVVTELVTTPRGARVEIDLGHPSAPGARPALLLAPGAGYHRRLPLLDRLFNRGLQRGFIVCRFDWAYQTAGTAPSPDGSAEAEDLRAVLDHLSADPFVDPRGLYVVGKSLGSIAGHQVAHADDRVRGEVLLTPVVRSQQDLDRHYPGLASTDRPVLLVVGRQDGEHCSLPLLHAGLADATGVTTLVVAGDHSLVVGEDELATERNLTTAIEQVICWLNTQTLVP